MLKKYLNKDGKVKYRIKQLVKNSTKAQSAMEYLMTYGWSILIIAIVLVSLFELGIFGSSSLSGNGSCIAQTQFLCTKPILASNGILMATIGETLGQITLTGTACLNNTAQPSSSSFNSVSPPVIINNGETFQIGFYCPITSNAIGTSFNGNLWMQYNTPAASGQIIKIGSVSLKVTLSATSSSGGSGGSPVYYTPITLSNQQSSATASGFQQMIYFNPSTYSSNEMANLSNIEFTAGAPIGTSGNVPLYAWIESGASSTATNTIAWVNLASNTLGAAGGANTLTIYMNFLPNNSPVTSGYTGYAPQLYCASGCFQTSYAQYDNGASVFNNYENYAGTTLWSGLTTGISHIAGDGAYVVQNNGLTIGVNSIDTGYSILTNWDLTSPFIYQSLITSENKGGAGNFQEGQIIDASSDIDQEISGGTCGQNWYIARRDIPGNFYQLLLCNTILAQSGASGSYPYISMETFSQNTTGLSVYDAGTTLANTIENTFQSGYVGYDLVFSSSINPNSIFIQYSRVRYYPPNDIMPSFNFGNIV